jgi:uncharacterized YigZ family protein
MYIIKDEFKYTLEIKRSKFITHIVPYNEFKTLMARLKEQHPKGRHFVYAYRYLNEYNQIVENSSDDGEPKGTSGKPSLKVLQGSDMINTAVIIVRYFGGIRLGTGGLTRAYSDAVNLVLDVSIKDRYRELQHKELSIEYSELSKVEYSLAQNNLSIVSKEFSNDVKLIIEGEIEDIKRFEQ